MLTQRSGLQKRWISSKRAHLIVHFAVKIYLTYSVKLSQPQTVASRTQMKWFKSFWFEQQQHKREWKIGKRTTDTQTCISHHKPNKISNGDYTKNILVHVAVHRIMLSIEVHSKTCIIAGDIREEWQANAHTRAHIHIYYGNK